MLTDPPKLFTEFRVSVAVDEAPVRIVAVTLSRLMVKSCILTVTVAE